MNWRMATIGEIVDSGGATIQTGPFGTQLRASDYVPDGIPVINVRNIGYGSIREDKLEYVPESIAERLEPHLLRGNDIVFGRRGAVDRHVLVRAKQDGWMQGSDCIRLRFDTDDVDAQFVSYAFLREPHKQWMLTQGDNKTTMAGLNHNIVRRIPFPLPPLATQRRIAATLSAYDDLIENNRRRMALLEEAMHLLYREWFVNLRFPGHERTAMVDGIPERWHRSTITDAFEITGGGTPSRQDAAYWDSGTIQWYTPSDLTKTGSMFMDASSEQITEVGLAESSARLFAPYSVMLTSRATIGVIAINTTEATTNQGFITCLPNQRTPLYYLYCWLTANRDIFESLATGATFKEISKSTFRRIPILLPGETVLDAFEEMARPIANQILNLQRQNRHLQAARDLLLPRLMNGSIPL